MPEASPSNEYEPSSRTPYCQIPPIIVDLLQVWSPGRGSPQFVLSANVRYPVHTLQYTPGLWQVTNFPINRYDTLDIQVLKWGWVQYLSFLIISLYAAAR